MKTLKYLIATITLIAVILACEKDPVNPEIKDSDLTIYIYGNGGDAHGLAWTGFDVPVGDSLNMRLMVSPKEGTKVKWETLDSVSVLINETLEYKYAPKEEGSIMLRFVATKNSYSDTLVFNFRGVIVEDLEGVETSELSIISDASDTNTIGPGQGETEHEASVSWAGSPNGMRVGGDVNWQDTDDFYDVAAVIPFEIPNLDGKKIVGARLDLTLTEVVDWAWQDYDLYGLPFRAEPTVLPSDHWQGEYGTDNNSVAIQQALATRESPVGACKTNDEANKKLTQYIKTQIKNGATAGDFIFLRVNVNVDDAPNYGRITIASADDTDDAKKPKLTLIIVED